MADETYRKTVNIVAIVASAAFAGGGLLILLSYGIRWLATDPLVWRAGFWDEFLNFAITIIPLNMITLVGLVLSVRLDWQDRPTRRVWMVAIWLYAANTLFTLGYFIPQNILLIRDSYTADAASQVRATWLVLHILRVIIAFALPVMACLAAIRRAEVAPRAYPRSAQGAAS
ncbi:hypothetical protein LGQ03_11845 [Loktanella sp. TSTF-M6]|uniref:DUF1772 domain-containing protein n=1 Tax=Loktanella gaetbuli TaxID=2881335 RepID=A0ABS8BW06_9RHOB|nr:hypothetical protein [Loktanella gaetbuli]MCB5199931.1 hypothetical protein [Loktanella gaetbuli]